MILLFDFGLIVFSASLLAVITLIVLFTIFIYQSVARQRYTPHLIVALFCGIISEIFLLPSIIPLYSDVSIHQFKFELLLVVFALNLAYYFIYLHYEALSNTKPPAWRHDSIFGILMVGLTLSALDLAGILPELASISFVFFINSLLGMLCFGFASLVTFRVHKIVLERTTIIEMTALLVLTVGSGLYVIGDIILSLNIINITIYYNIILFLGETSSLVALIILVIHYVMNIDYVYRLPFPVQQIIFYNSNGLLVYARRVHTPGVSVSTSSGEIMVGIFAAISDLIQDNIGKNAKLGHIDIETHQIFFAHTPDDMGTLSIITSSSSYFIQRSLDRFVRNIPTEIIKKINAPGVIFEGLKETFDSLIKRSFPYLIFKDT